MKELLDLFLRNLIGDNIGNIFGLILEGILILIVNKISMNIREEITGWISEDIFKANFPGFSSVLTN